MMRMFTPVAFAILTMVLAIPVLNAQVVNSFADSGPGSLRQEVLDANPGDTITFGVLITNIVLSSEIVIDKELTIINNNLLDVTLNGGGTNRIFNITAGPVSLHNLTLTNGTATDGGAIYVANAAVNITDCVLTNNEANGASGSGGAIFNAPGGSLNIANTSITLNRANRAGGGIEDNAGAGLNIILTNVTLNNNTAGIAPSTPAPGSGGGLHITGAGSIVITGGTVNNNTAALEGGGLWNGTGTMTVTGTVIDGNTARGATADDGGGGVFNNGGNVNLDSVTVSNNLATGAAGSGGGLLSIAGDIAIDASVFEGNSATRAGGAIEIIDGDLEFISSQMINNDVNGTAGIAAPGNGGGFHGTGNASNITFRNSMITGNAAAREGGGLWNQSGSTMNVVACILEDNTAFGDAEDDGGGAIFNNGGTLNIDSTQIIDNLAAGDLGSGGGLFSTDGDVSINHTAFSSNIANRAGGGIEIIDGNVDITNCVLNQNEVLGTASIFTPGNGGALHVTGMNSTVNISSSIINMNKAQRQGGGLWNYRGSTMNVTNCTIDGNTTDGPLVTQGGGGIYNRGGILNIETTTISNNVTAGTSAAGGGVHNDTLGVVKIMRSTISGNSAHGLGGGIYTKGDSMITNAVTIANNSTTGTGGGIYSVYGAWLTNTLISGNTGGLGGGDVHGMLYSRNYNLIATDGLNSFTPMANDIEGTAPILGILQDNGGNTLTHMLMDGSAGINAGDPAVTFNDQRDMPIMGIRDIGAYESGSVGINEVNTVLNSSLYPNPTTGTVNIKLTDNASEGTVSILSLTGSMVAQSTVDGNTQSIDLSALPVGAYLVRVQTSTSVTTHSLLLAK